MTGTPAGCGTFMGPPRFLRPGDVVTCSATGIGELTNRVVAGSATHPMTDAVVPALVARRIDHVGVAVVDMDAAIARFAADLGLLEESRWRDPEGRFELAYLACGDTTLQLVRPMAPGAVADFLAQRGEGLHHVCFTVDDLDEAVASARGGAAATPYMGGRGARVCFLAERPHGVLVELTEAPG